MKKLSYAIIALLLASCAWHPHLEAGLSYPDMLSPIYFLDTFQIREPVVVAYIDDIPYITTEAILRDTLDKTPLAERKGVIRYLIQVVTLDKIRDYIEIHKNLNNNFLYAYQRKNELINEGLNLLFMDSINGMAIYRFDLQPRNYLLTMITKKDSMIMTHGGVGDLANDVIIGVEYSNDYMFALSPLFSRKDRKTLLKREFDWLHKR